MRGEISELFKFIIGSSKFLCLLFELLRLPAKFDEYGYFRLQHFRNDRSEKIIHSTKRITTRSMIIVRMNRGHKDDGRIFRTFPLADQHGGFKPIHDGHMDI